MDYDAKSQLLEIEFQDSVVHSVVHKYYGVSSSVYEGLMRVSSHRRYFDQYIGDYYLYRRVK